MGPTAHDLHTKAICIEAYSIPASPPRRNERAEGVISTAISVLIIAFLGIALWTGFNSMMNGATEKTRAQVEQIGN